MLKGKFLFVLFLFCLSLGCSSRSIVEVSSPITPEKKIPIHTRLSINGRIFKVGDMIEIIASVEPVETACSINPRSPWWHNYLDVAQRKYFENNLDSDAFMLPNGKKPWNACSDSEEYIGNKIMLYEGDTLLHKENIEAKVLGKYRAVFQIQSWETVYLDDPKSIGNAKIEFPNAAWEGKTEPIYIDFEVVK